MSLDTERDALLNVWTDAMSRRPDHAWYYMRAMAEVTPLDLDTVEGAQTFLSVLIELDDNLYEKVRTNVVSAPLDTPGGIVESSIAHTFLTILLVAFDAQALADACKRYGVPVSEVQAFAQRYRLTDMYSDVKAALRFIDVCRMFQCLDIADRLLNCFEHEMEGTRQ